MWVFCLIKFLCLCQVITESLSEKEIAGLSEMFRAIDAHNSDEITFEALKSGIKRFGADLRKSEISEFMQSVSSIYLNTRVNYKMLLKCCLIIYLIT